MVAGASTETMTDLRQFCSRHAARFWPVQVGHEAHAPESEKQRCPCGGFGDARCDRVSSNKVEHDLLGGTEFIREGGRIAGPHQNVRNKFEVCCGLRGIHIDPLCGQLY